MATLTKNKDTDIIILQQLSDYELGKVCSVNKYVNSICNDDKFWLNRTMLKFQLTGEETNKMKKYLGFGTYKELYVYLSTFYTYILDSDIKIKREDVIYLFKNEKMIDELIEKNLQPILPRWMNRQELVYEIRRKIPEMLLTSKQYGEKKLDLRMSSFFLRISRIQRDFTPPLTYENAKNYDNFKF